MKNFILALLSVAPLCSFAADPCGPLSPGEKIKTLETLNSNIGVSRYSVADPAAIVNAFCAQKPRAGRSVILTIQFDTLDGLHTGEAQCFADDIRSSENSRSDACFNIGIFEKNDSYYFHGKQVGRY